MAALVFAVTIVVVVLNVVDSTVAALIGVVALVLLLELLSDWVSRRLTSRRSTANSIGVRSSSTSPCSPRVGAGAHAHPGRLGAAIAAGVC